MLRLPRPKPSPSYPPEPIPGRISTYRLQQMTTPTIRRWSSEIAATTKQRSFALPPAALIALSELQALAMVAPTTEHGSPTMPSFSILVTNAILNLRDAALRSGPKPASTK